MSNEAAAALITLGVAALFALVVWMVFLTDGLIFLVIGPGIFLWAVYRSVLEVVTRKRPPVPLRRRDK